MQGLLDLAPIQPGFSHSGVLHFFHAASPATSENPAKIATTKLIK